MNIRELDSRSKYAFAEVTLYYDELRDLSNGLYELCDKNEEMMKKYGDVYKKMSLLFDLVKNGMLSSEVAEMFVYRDKEEKSSE